ncbi:MAG: hypothetical protein CM15mP49_16350 [Actinomycetota bacterium]|nr:MAG: hypothetical protein CM15mP49_16350 [Actinomycetota bacterium]
MNRHVKLSLTKFMFCSPAEGGVALLLARADQAHKYTDTPVYLNAAVVRSRRGAHLK